MNQAQLLLAGRLDMTVTSNSLLALNYAQEKLPAVAVAAFFQKDPSVLIAHAGQGNDSFEALRGKAVMLGADARAGWWNFLKARFGYTDAQVRPYTFNLQPFAASKAAIQEGYATSEPFSIEKETGEAPVVLMLADAGFDGYGCLVSVREALIEAHPDVVRRFVEASREGWASYLHGDPAPGNALIRRDNPEMPEALLAYGRQALIDRGIVDSGDGIGMMTEARWEHFARAMEEEGLYPKDLDWRRAYTLRFLPH